jgi:hypothetical protein
MHAGTYARHTESVVGVNSGEGIHDSLPLSKFLGRQVGERQRQGVDSWLMVV